VIIKIIRKCIWAGIHTIIQVVEGVSYTRSTRGGVALVTLKLITHQTFILIQIIRESLRASRQAFRLV
jgi:hypothetical protein